jgi:hypothetical protein
VIRVTMQYFDDCPNWHIAADRLLDAIDRLGRDLFEVSPTRCGGGCNPRLLEPALHPPNSLSPRPSPSVAAATS